MSGMDLNEVEPDLFASFNSYNESVFDALYVVLGHRDRLRVARSEGDVTRTVNYLVSRVGLTRIWSRGEGKPQTIVRPTALTLKCQLPGGSDGPRGILVNPGGESRSLAAGMCKLDSDKGVVAMREVNDTF